MMCYKKFILYTTLLFSVIACEKVDIASETKDTSHNNSVLNTADIVKGNTQFAVDIYKQLVNEDENQMISPYSISTAMSMAYAGTAGTTANQVQSVFGFGANTNSFHQLYNQLSNNIESSINNTLDNEIKIINKIWRSQNMTFLTDFENTMTHEYLAPVVPTDFTQTTAAKQAINNWVDQQTKQLIPDFLPDGFIQPNTAFVLVNAMYFKADWMHQFSTGMTQPQSFKTTSSSVTTDMMSELIPTNELKFTEDSDVEVLELFFKDQKSSMLIILPKNQNLGIESFVQQNLSYSKLNQWIDNLAYPAAGSNFSVQIPKWKFETDFDLAETLINMGVQDAFSPSANFSKMTASSLMLDKVKHKTVIEAHEGGVEAAAATAVGGVFTSVPPVARNFVANRPFVFVIKEAESNSVLFIGHVQDPS